MIDDIIEDVYFVWSLNVNEDTANVVFWSYHDGAAYKYIEENNDKTDNILYIEKKSLIQQR